MCIRDRRCTAGGPGWSQTDTRARVSGSPSQTPQHPHSTQPSRRPPRFRADCLHTARVYGLHRAVAALVCIDDATASPASTALPHHDVPAHPRTGVNTICSCKTLQNSGVGEFEQRFASRTPRKAAEGAPAVAAGTEANAARGDFCRSAARQEFGSVLLDGQRFRHRRQVVHRHASTPAARSFSRRGAGAAEQRQGRERIPHPAFTLRTLRPCVKSVLASKGRLRD